MHKIWKRGLIAFIFLGAGVAGLWTSWVMHRARVFHAPVQFVAAIKKQAHAGEKVYREYCAYCHDPKPLIQVGAPRVGYPDDWKCYQGVDLLTMALTGRGAMPARGGCFECDDDLIRQSIDYMLRG